MSITCRVLDSQGSSIAARGWNAMQGFAQRYFLSLLKDRTRWFRRVDVEKGGGTAGRTKSARVMPGDLSGGQFVIVCQPLYTVNTTNCRLIQMRTGRVEFARCLSASSLETRRVSKFRLVHVSLLIRPINLKELLLPFHLFVPLTIRHLCYQPSVLLNVCWNWN